MQLIHYAPKTEHVYSHPMLIIPPWINKFYVFDLQQNSMIQYLLDQGINVFIISWVNATPELAKEEFSNYMLDGAKKAMDEVINYTKAEKINLTGYCLGGILQTCLLAWLSREGKNPVASATFLATLLDFSHPGEIQVFLSKEQIDKLECYIRKEGVLAGHILAEAFNTLRADNLTWNAIINNYFLGKDWQPFDILYWNSDYINMPPEVFLFYIRNFYQENALIKSGVEIAGRTLFARDIKTPSFVFAAKDDHLAPWQSSYVARKLFKGPVEYILGSSGHIAGVFNSPQQNKYGYWRQRQNPAHAKQTSKGITSKQWLTAAQQEDGSWWPYWARWLKPFLGKKIAASSLHKGACLEEAPGSYAKVTNHNRETQ